MKDKKGPSVAFRPWTNNAKRITWAKAAGLNASELINQVLGDHLKTYIENELKAKAEKIRQTMTGPVP